jgi:hypothetical protein
MDGTLERNVRAAAAAAWWTLAAAAVFLAIQWILYLWVMSARPEWVTPLWGPGTSWETFQTAWFAGLVFLKLTLWLLVLGALFLTLWARRLR